MIVLSIIASIPFLISLYNLATFPKLRKGIPKEKKLVSIIIPARNEQENIAECLNSIFTSSYENIEVIVVDDNSDDDTYKIAKSFKNVKVIKGKELKKGWKGKNWACYQGYEHSKGEYLLFIDADVRLGKDVISDSINHIQSLSIELLSVFPHLTSNTVLGQINVNNLKWLLISFLPLSLIKDSTNPGLMAASGAYLLFSRTGYKSIDGHLGIKSEPVEDLSLVYNMKKLGNKVDFVLGSPDDINCIMYPNLQSSVNGLSRSLTGTLNKFKYGNLAIIFLSILPPISAAITFFQDHNPTLLTLILFNYLNSIILSYQNPLYILSVPLQYIFFLITILFTVVNQLKKEVTWKGREL